MVSERPQRAPPARRLRAALRRDSLLTTCLRKYLNQIRRNAGPFTDPEATSEELLAQFEKFKVL